jgi:hypothetical protein
MPGSTESLKGGDWRQAISLTKDQRYEAGWVSRNQQMTGDI